MRRLILIRHSLPAVQRDVPAAQWHLSPEGIARAHTLSRRLHIERADRVFTSSEPKAAETASIVAEQWGLASEEVPGLHEHERPDAQLMAREAFEQKIRELFARPGELVFGAETAEQARRRFTAAVVRLVTRSRGDLVVVTHGTVMTLFVAGATGVEPFAFWRRQEMPFAVSLTVPELRLEATTFLERP